MGYQWVFAGGWRLRFEGGEERFVSAATVRSFRRKSLGWFRRVLVRT